MKNICAVVMPDGLMLDPFDRIPLTIQTDPGTSMKWAHHFSHLHNAYVL